LKKKNNFFTLLSFIIIPFILFLLFELIFYSSYLIAKNKFFENYKEAVERKASSYLNLEKNLQEIKLNKKKKIAIFGGSIAFGYALTSNFGNIIQQLNLEDLVVHNYSENGAVFSRYQSELLKVLMPHYDYLIVYSGDNEMWSNLCFRAIENGKVILPDNMIIDERCREEHEKKIKKINQFLNKENYYFNSSKNFFIENSRLYLFIDRVYFRLKNYFTTKIFNEQKIKKFDYLIRENFFDKDEKLKLINNFKSSLDEVKSRLNDEQKLIFIKPISNDLVPPAFDFVDKNISKKYLSDLNFYIEGNYARLLNNTELHIDNNEYKVNHIDFFLGIDCLNKKKEFKNCFSFLINSRNEDKFPLRILKEIETEIMNSVNNKTKVINLDQNLFLENNINDYRNYFIDAHHLSIESHLLIAKEILKEIYLGEDDLIYKKLDQCENYLLRWKNNDFKLMHDKNTFKNILDVRLDWQKKFMTKSDHKFNLNFFYENVKLKISSCLN
jgi:hypothetical protein